MKKVTELNYDRLEISKLMLNKCFYTFFQESFLHLNPGKKLAENWHLKYLACLLEEIYEKKYKNVIICVPPRSLKSTMINVAWSAWVLAKNPQSRIMSASYSARLSLKHSVDTRSILSSSWVKNYFPHFRFAQDQNCKNKFATDSGGYRMATSVGGSAIGEGADILICDDPLSPMQAMSKKFRDRVYSWYMESFATRLDDKKNGIKIIVMQRLHDDDLCGRIIANLSSIWKIINIPAIANEDTHFKLANFYKLYKQNEILNDSYEGAAELEMMQKQLGSRAFAAQYLQNPLHEDGKIIKNEWLSYYDHLPQETPMVVQSWDLAFTGNENSDYSVCTTWFVYENKYFLAHVYRERRKYIELISDFNQLLSKWNPDLILVEDTVASKAFIDHVKMIRKDKIISIKPRGDKLTRLVITTPLFEEKMIFIPNDKVWQITYVEELLSFPNVRHDDQVDSTTQFLNYINKIRSAKNGKKMLTLL